MKILNLKIITAIVLILSLSSFACEDEPKGDKGDAIVKKKEKKVLFIGIDGLVWKTLIPENAPTLSSLMKESWVSTNAVAELPTWSANGWSALFTGVSVEKHKAKTNSFANADFVNYPSFFRYIKQKNPNARTVSAVSWLPIHDKIIADSDVTSKISSTGANYAEADAKDEIAIVDELTNRNPDVVFCYFADVDGVGHSSNFKPTNPTYLKAVKKADQRVANVLAALKARPNYKNEDWLIVVSTDHGGDGSHGGSSYPEQNAFIILNNKAIKPKLISGETIVGAPYLYNVPPTILSFLGVPIPENYDGKSLVKF